MSPQIHSRFTPRNVRVICDIENGLDNQRFVTKPGLFAEVFLAVSENRLDIPLGGGGEDVSSHRSYSTSADWET